VLRARRFGDGNGPVGSRVGRGIITKKAGHCEVMNHLLDAPEKNYPDQPGRNFGNYFTYLEFEKITPAKMPL